MSTNPSSLVWLSPLRQYVAIKSDMNSLHFSTVSGSCGTPRRTWTTQAHTPATNNTKYGDSKSSFFDLSHRNIPTDVAKDLEAIGKHGLAKKTWSSYATAERMLLLLLKEKGLRKEGRCGPQSLSFPFPGNPRNSDIPCLPGSGGYFSRYDRPGIPCGTAFAQADRRRRAARPSV